ncbi:MAG: hypothetical protein U1F11_12170 [Steroidobacteraceae bacterium]
MTHRWFRVPSLVRQSIHPVRRFAGVMGYRQHQPTSIAFMYHDLVRKPTDDESSQSGKRERLRQRRESDHPEVDLIERGIDGVVEPPGCTRWFWLSYQAAASRYYRCVVQTQRG